MLYLHPTLLPARTAPSADLSAEVIITQRRFSKAEAIQRQIQMAWIADAGDPRTIGWSPSGRDVIVNWFTI
jgi:hypothetical protein